MKDHLKWQTLAGNFLMLIIIVLPLFLVTAGLIARLMGLKSDGDVLGTAMALYPAFVLPFSVGGVAYLAALRLLLRRAKVAKSIVVALALIVAIGLVPFEARYALRLPHFLIALVLLLLLYGLIVSARTDEGDAQLARN